MIYEKIQADIKTAMKEKDVIKKNALKNVQTKVQTIVKEEKKELTDEVVITAINKELKQLNQTLDAIKGQPDSDLYKDTSKMVELLKTYLPAQLSEEEVKVEVQKIIAENGDVKGGKLVGLVMKTLKGKADNGLIKKCIDDLTK